MKVEGCNHIIHPFSQGSIKLRRWQKGIALTGLILTPLFIFPGLLAFYGLSYYFKATQLKLLEQDNESIASRTNLVSTRTLPPHKGSLTRSSSNSSESLTGSSADSDEDESTSTRASLSSSESNRISLPPLVSDSTTNENIASKANLISTRTLSQNDRNNGSLTSSSSSSSESLTSSSADSDEDESNSTRVSVSSSETNRISLPPLVSDSTTADDDDAEWLLEGLERLHLSHEIQNSYDILRSDNDDKLVLLEQIKKQIPNWPEYLRYLAKHQSKDFNLLFSAALESTTPGIYMDFIRVLDQADFDEHLASLNNSQIIFGNQALPANSTVLRHISPYFDRMFSSGLREAQTNIIHLPEQDYELFEKLFPSILNLHFFDKSLGLSGDNLTQYLYLAEEYQFLLIKEACEEWILANFENIDMDPRDFFNLADQYHLDSIKSKMVHRLIPLYLESSATSQPQKTLIKEACEEWILANFENIDMEPRDLFNLADQYHLESIKSKMVHRLIQSYLESAAQRTLLEEWLSKVRFLDLGANSFESSLKLCTKVETLKITIHDKESISLLKTLPNLRNLELTIVRNIDDEAIKNLRGLPISWLKARFCRKITNQGLAYLKNLPLKSLSLGWNNQITDQELAYLKGLPLKSLTLKWSEQITDQGLVYLKDLPLESLTLKWASQITDQGLVYLKDLPLKSLTLSDIKRITDQGLAQLIGLPLKSLVITWDDILITDQGLAHLNSLPLEELTLIVSETVTDQAKASLRENMPNVRVKFKRKRVNFIGNPAFN